MVTTEDIQERNIGPGWYWWDSGEKFVVAYEDHAEPDYEGNYWKVLNATAGTLDNTAYPCLSDLLWHVGPRDEADMYPPEREPTTFEWKIVVSLPLESLKKKVQDMNAVERFFLSVLGDDLQPSVGVTHTLHRRCSTVVGVENDVRDIESAGLKVTSLLKRSIADWETVDREELE